MSPIIFVRLLAIVLDYSFVWFYMKSFIILQNNWAYFLKLEKNIRLK